VFSRDMIHRHRWSVLPDKAEVEGYMFHSLRHADVQTTVNIYGHLFPSESRK